MGVDYYARAVIGIRIPREKLFVKRGVRTCSAGHPGKGPYCSLCGRAVDQEQEMPIEGIDRDNDRLFGRSLTWSTDKLEAFVGLIVAPDDPQEAGFAALDDAVVSRVRGSLKAALEPHGLWDETAFGLWAVLYCSY